jgi:hypothetical protein
MRPLLSVRYGFASVTQQRVRFQQYSNTSGDSRKRMLTTKEISEVHRLVSTARLSSYSRYLGTSSAVEAYGAYMWSAAVSAAFTPLVQAVEIGLRNSLHDALSASIVRSRTKHYTACCAIS